MAEGKKGFVLYADIIHTVKKLPNDKAGELFKFILDYVNDKNPNTDDLITQLAFEPIKQSLKRDLEKYEARCKRNKENGNKGGRPPRKPTEEIINPKKPTGLNGLQDKPKKPDSDTDSDSDIIYSFDDFWKKYPKKVGKKDCEKIFSKLKDSELQKIKDTLDLFITYKPFESYNHPNPKSYLNQKRWEDEISTESTVSNKPKTVVTINKPVR